jgi:hypothetical protein
VPQSGLQQAAGKNSSAGFQPAAAHSPQASRPAGQQDAGITAAGGGLREPARDGGRVDPDLLLGLIDERMNASRPDEGQIGDVYVKRGARRRRGLLGGAG